MSKTLVRVLMALLAMTLVASACSACSASSDGDSGGKSGGATGEPVDYKAIGLWDDGPCDESKEPLTVGLMTVFESPVVSLEDQALALEASAVAFNARGGANGSCIKVVTCDDGANVDQSMACVRTLDEAGVVATVNDQGTAGQAEVSAAMADAGIPRVATNVTPSDWDDQNAYPLDASGTGVTFLMPQGLIEQDITEIGLIRVDLAAASALKGIMEDTYEGEATFPVDVPVPAGTTDFSQFILAADDGGAGGVTLAIGEQEAVQVVRAGQQLGTDLKIGSSLGTFSQSNIAELGDFADQMVFLSAFAPATVDLPVYKALRADLAASGEESLQPENVKTSPMRSWIGLYALLRVLRDSNTTTFSRENVTKALDEAKDVPMLDIYGGENWTPSLDRDALWSRVGTDHWAVFRWDPAAASPTEVEGNFVEEAQISFDEVLCGTPFGAAEPCP